MKNYNQTEIGVQTISFKNTLYQHKTTSLASNWIPDNQSSELL